MSCPGVMRKIMENRLDLEEEICERGERMRSANEVHTTETEVVSIFRSHAWMWNSFIPPNQNDLFGRKDEECQ